MQKSTMSTISGTFIRQSTLSGRTGSALARHTQGRVFASWLLYVLRFVARAHLHCVIRRAQGVPPCVG